MAYRKRKIYPYIALGCFLAFLCGCARATEMAKGFVGISTEVLEDNRKTALRQVFDCNYEVAYNESMAILKARGCYVYAGSPDKKMFAIYISETDTTPVGIFFKVVDDTHVQIEVSSPSTYGKELIAGKLFAALEKVLSNEGGRPNGEIKDTMEIE